VFASEGENGDDAKEDVEEVVVDVDWEGEA
jgi:hypothetical protein